MVWGEKSLLCKTIQKEKKKKYYFYTVIDELNENGDKTTEQMSIPKNRTMIVMLQEGLAALINREGSKTGLFKTHELDYWFWQFKQIP